MFNGVYRFLGLNVGEKRTTVRSVFNSFLIIGAFGGVILFPTFMVYVEQANQLKNMDENIVLSFEKVDALKEEIRNVGGKDFLLNEAQDRLKMVSSVAEEPNTENTVESQDENPENSE
jgi:hypothetical protein